MDTSKKWFLRSTVLDKYQLNLVFLVLVRKNYEISQEHIREWSITLGGSLLNCLHKEWFITTRKINKFDQTSQLYSL